MNYHIDPSLAKRHIGYRYPALTVTRTTRIARAMWRVRQAHEVLDILDKLDRDPLGPMRRSVISQRAVEIVGLIGIAVALWFGWAS